jgi:hypothetical protein
LYLVINIIHCLLSILLTIVSMPIIMLVHLFMLPTSIVLNKEAKQLSCNYLHMKLGVNQFEDTHKINNDITLDRVLEATNSTLSDIIVATGYDITTDFILVDNDGNIMTDIDLRDSHKIYIIKDSGDNINDKFDFRGQTSRFFHSRRVHLLLTMSLERFTYCDEKAIDALVTLNVGNYKNSKEPFYSINKKIKEIKAVRLHSVEEQRFIKGATVGFFSPKLSQQIMTKGISCPELPEEIAVHLSQFLDRKTASRLAQVNRLSNDTAKAMYNTPGFN